MAAKVVRKSEIITDRRVSVFGLKCDENSNSMNVRVTLEPSNEAHAATYIAEVSITGMPSQRGWRKFSSSNRHHPVKSKWKSMEKKDPLANKNVISNLKWTVYPEKREEERGDSSCSLSNNWTTDRANIQLQAINSVMYLNSVRVIKMKKLQLFLLSHMCLSTRLLYIFISLWLISSSPCYGFCSVLRAEKEEEKKKEFYNSKNDIGLNKLGTCTHV